MMTYPIRKLTLIISCFLVFLMAVGCTSPASSTPSTSSTSSTIPPSPKILGEYVLEGQLSEVGVSSGTTGEINGKDFLFLGTVENGPPADFAIQILDLTDPANPLKVGLLDRLSVPIVDMQFSGNKLVAVAMNFMMIVDVSNPEQPVEISRFSDNSAFGGITISGNYAFVRTSRDNNGNILVIDISNPANPQKVKSLKTLENLSKIMASDSLLLAVGVSGFQIFDIAVHGSFEQVGSFANPDYKASAVPGDIFFGKDYFLDGTISGKYAYIASGISGLRVIDLSRPESPAQISNLKTQGTAARILNSGNLIYLIDWREPLLPQNTLPILIINIADPHQPKQIGSIGLPPYFNFNFTNNSAYLYYFGNDPSVKIVSIY